MREEGGRKEREREGRESRKSGQEDLGRWGRAEGGRGDSPHSLV